MSAQLSTIEQRKWWEPFANGARWVAFIPGGIAGGVLTGIIASAFVGCSSWLYGHSFDTPLSRLIAAGSFGYTSIVCAAQIAPTPKKTIPAIAMAILIFMFYGICIFVCAIAKDWFGIVQSIFAAAGAAVAMYIQIPESARQ